jgi:hypothetical protein
LLAIKILFPYYKNVTFTNAFDHLKIMFIYIMLKKPKFYVTENTPLVLIYCEIVQYPHTCMCACMHTHTHTHTHGQKTELLNVHASIEYMWFC